jgi:Zn-dependent peptidase ImmA (M78 family)
VSVSVQDKEANAFAMALLMPAEWLTRDADEIAASSGVLDDADVSSLAKRYRVSVVMMTIRLRELGYGFCP